MGNAESPAPLGSVMVVNEISYFRTIKYRIKRIPYMTIMAWRSICDRAKWIGHKPGNLETYAERELRLAGWFKEDGMYGDMMGRAVLRMIREFSEEGHSGMSGGLAISLFKKVASFEPLQPLTGEDSEWTRLDYEGGAEYQNKRCSRVFKGADGRAYDIEGRVFREPDGSCYTNSESRVYIEFPYTPHTEYVDVAK